MSSYYDNHKDFDQRGIDYDLIACLDNNPQPFNENDIETVLAVYEGERDEEDWRWVLQLKDGRYVFLQGGCDYTGWDCQSWADHEFAGSPAEAAKHAEEDQGVYSSLMGQLETRKSQTWREKKDAEFGLTADDAASE